MVEVPLFPGFAEGMVMLVAVSVRPGLVTVRGALPEEAAYDESPPYVATIVLLPTAKPRAVVAELTVSVAEPTPVAPGVIFALPTVVLPMVKVTVPATVPAVADFTVAVSVSGPLIAIEAALRASVVVVGATPEAITLMVVTGLAETKKPVAPEYAA